MTNMVIVAAVLRRLHESQVTDEVKADLLSVREQLKKIIEDADANHNITKDQGKKFVDIMKVCYKLEDLIESNEQQENIASRRDHSRVTTSKISGQQIKDIEELCEKLISFQLGSENSGTRPIQQLLETVTVDDAVETEESIVKMEDLESSVSGLTPKKDDAVETEETIVKMEETESSVSGLTHKKDDAVETEETIDKMEEAESSVFGLTHKKDDAVERLVSALNDKNSRLYMVGICGKPGTGKTSLATELYEKPSIKKEFDVRAWACVSQQFESKRIFQEILAIISDTGFERRKKVDMPEEELAELVYKCLQGKRYLIMLDDVRSIYAWHRLRLAFPDDDKGSRVLITTRNKEVAQQVGAVQIETIGTLRPLSEQMKNGWQMLARKLNLNEDKIDHDHIIREIARLCGSYRLSLDIIGGLLSKTPNNEWNQLVEQLSVIGRDPTDSRVHRIIKLGYKYLPIYLRPCLLYMVNFPKDTATECDTVCQLWIAEGLISMENIRNGETMMDVAERCLDELANRSFLITEDQVSRQRRFKACRIHDLIYDFCRIRGEEDKFFEVIHLGNETQQNRCSSLRRAINLDSNKYNESLLFGTSDYIRSLLFFISSESEEGIIRPRRIPTLGNFSWLRVLYLHGVDFTDGKLPKGVEKLLYLRYLSFRECYLEELSPLVGNMLFLQTLDLRVRNECEMIITDVFGNFERLKYLYFPLTFRTVNRDKLHLEKLKEMEILDNFDTSVCNAEDLSGLIKLQKLTITTEGDVSEIERILNALENNTSCSISLNIRNFDCHSSKRISAMKKVFNSRALHVLEVEGYLGKFPVFNMISSDLTELILSGSRLVEDPMQILQDLPNLTILVLEMEAYNEEIMECSLPGFRKLKYLKLFKLYKLHFLELKDAALPSLHTLVIENCKNLEMLPDGLEYCEQLQKLEIVSMPDAFVGRIQMPDGTEGDDFYKIEYLQKNVKIDGRHLIKKEI